MASEKRLIDANALIDLLRPLEEVSQIIKKILRIIRNCPTVDAVEVVRCKDCKHQGHCEIEELVFHVVNGDNPYCSYGERKDNG